MTGAVSGRTLRQLKNDSAACSTSIPNPSLVFSAPALKVATSIISALKKIPIRQDTAMTGSLSVRGEVLPIGGVSAKVEAAIEAGVRKVLVPKSNLKDIVIDPKQLRNIKIIPVEYISEVLKEALDWKGKESILKKISDHNSK